MKTSHAVGILVGVHGLLLTAAICGTVFSQTAPATPAVEISQPVKANKTSLAVVTSPADDLATGNVSIKNGTSKKCGVEIMQNRATPECEAEGQRWSDELHEKLSHPEWRAQFERKLNRITQ